MRILLVSLIITSFLVPLNIAKADSHNEGKKFVGASSGYEGREDQLGRAMSVVLMSLNETKPYQHDINDALVKMILTTIQFAKDNNIIDISSDLNGLVKNIFNISKKYGINKIVYTQKIPEGMNGGYFYRCLSRDETREIDKYIDKTKIFS